MTEPERLAHIETVTTGLSIQLQGLTDALHESRVEMTAARASTDEAIALATRRSEEVREEAAQHLRRRLVVVAVALFVLTAVAVVSALVVGNVSARFNRVSDHLVANCVVGRARTQAQLDLTQANLAADTASLARLTGVDVRPEIRTFAHGVFDGRIRAERTYLDTVPKGLIDCAAYR